MKRLSLTNPSKMKSKRLLWSSLVLLVGAYFLGPEPETPHLSLDFPTVPSASKELEEYVRNLDKGHVVKPGNESEIVWYDTGKSKTEYAVLYLHGFSASKMEGDPVHRQFARKFGCNLYLPRLADHGIDTTETLLLFTVDRVWESAKTGLAIAGKLGNKVIVIGTSTGATLALKLAAEYPDRIHALINLSPNIEINNGAAFLLNDPWGIYIARIVVGDKYRVTGATPEHAKYWNKKYRLEALTELQELLEVTMNDDTFEKVRQPSLTLYYYKDEDEQDPEVKVSAMLEMHQKLATPEHLKMAKAMPKTGFHVIGSSQTSQDVPGVFSEMDRFAREKLGLKSVN